MINTSYIYVVVTLLVAILTLAFWLGAESQTVAALKIQLDLSNPIINDHRITILEQQVSELERTCERRVK
jgi:hypothetical protein